jgi:hypothetical protein
VKNAERMLRLSRKLPAVLAGKEKPADDAERVGLAQLCQQPYQRRYAASARLWQEAFRKQPLLAAFPQNDNRYNAACAAALAGCGQGEGADKLAEKEKADWRQQAQRWLQADLALWKVSAGSPNPQARQAVQARMHIWQEDADLAGVRDSAALAALPTSERDAWCRLWAEVADTLAKAQQEHQSPDRKPSPTAGPKIEKKPEFVHRVGGPPNRN